MRKTKVDQHEFDGHQHGPQPPSSSPTNILPSYLPLRPKLSSSIAAQVRAQSVTGNSSLSVKLTQQLRDHASLTES